MSAFSGEPLSRAAELARAVHEQALALSSLPTFEESLLIYINTFELGRLEWFSQSVGGFDDIRLKPAVLSVVQALAPLSINIGPHVRKLDISVPIFPDAVDVLGGVFPNIQHLRFDPPERLFGHREGCHVDKFGECLKRALLCFPMLSWLSSHEEHLSKGDIPEVLDACAAAQCDPCRETCCCIRIYASYISSNKEALVCKKRWEALQPQFDGPPKVRFCV